MQKAIITQYALNELKTQHINIFKTEYRYRYTGSHQIYSLMELWIHPNLTAINAIFQTVQFGNKPSFCSGSCNEIHARRKLQNKTSLKYLNFLETQLTQNTLETSLKSFRNCLETYLKHLWTFLDTPTWSSLGGIWEQPSIFVGTPLKLPWNILETTLKLQATIEFLVNTFESHLKLHWNTLQSSLNHPWDFLETLLKLPWNTI